MTEEGTREDQTEDPLWIACRTGRCDQTAQRMSKEEQRLAGQLAPRGEMVSSTSFQINNTARSGRAAVPPHIERVNREARIQQLRDQLIELPHVTLSMLGVPMLEQQGRSRLRRMPDVACHASSDVPRSAANAQGTG